MNYTESELKRVAATFKVQGLHGMIKYRVEIPLEFIENLQLNIKPEVKDAR